MVRASLGLKEEAAVWTGWTAFSSRAFQSLPGASLKQKEEVELPVGTLPTNHDPKGTAALKCGEKVYSQTSMGVYH